MPDDDVVSGVLSITGGAGGIGAAVARRFAATGGRVVVADIDEPAGQAVAAEIGGLFIRTDVTREEDNRAALEAAVAEFGGLDLVHVNAGTGGFGLENFRPTVAVNLEGTMFGLHAALPALAANGGGAVVVTASLAGLGPAAFDPVHSATGVTGEAWTVQAGAPPAPVVFPAIHMPRTV
jgi:NAD(P)-dependent dehydrogenase (short-subunit alcohol dehydrogenase family)